MKAILISIKSKWCVKIMNGDKTIEVRKSKALANAIQKLIDEYGYADIYVYCSKGNHHLVKPRDYDKYLIFTNGAVKHSGETSLNGKVLFKFRCYKVEEFLIKPNGLFHTNKLSINELLTQSCLSQKEILLYATCYNSKLSGYWINGYAIHISDLEIFDKPKELSEFRKNNSTGNCWKCKLFGSGCSTCQLTKAPQNFCYVEVE